MAIKLKLAETPDEWNDVFRFRYRVYVEEMRREQKYADHKARTVKEPLDDTGTVAVAHEDGELVGTVRLNLARDGTLGHYVNLYEMRRFGSYFPKHSSITTKLMVAQSHRSGSLGLRLCKLLYLTGLKAGVYFDFIDCNLPLKPFFTRLGYRQIQPNINHPEYGQVHPMVLTLYDGKHLRSVNSPFVSYLPIGAEEEHPSVAHFTKTVGICNSVSVCAPT